MSHTFYDVRKYRHFCRQLSYITYTIQSTQQEDTIKKKNNRSNFPPTPFALCFQYNKLMTSRKVLKANFHPQQSEPIKKIYTKLIHGVRLTSLVCFIRNNCVKDLTTLKWRWCCLLSLFIDFGNHWLKNVVNYYQTV
jgi:hypothetical protein